MAHPNGTRRDCDLDGRAAGNQAKDVHGTRVVSALECGAHVVCAGHAKSVRVRSGERLESELEAANKVRPRRVDLNSARG